MTSDGGLTAATYRLLGEILGGEVPLDIVRMADLYQQVQSEFHDEIASNTRHLVGLERDIRLAFYREYFNGKEFTPESVCDAAEKADIFMAAVISGM